MKINLLDLFSGIGGFHLGLQQAGFKIRKVYFSEIDKHAIAIYKYHFREAEYVGDVRFISRSTIRDRIDAATFGSPCQDLSVSGKGLGLEGSRSGLIREPIRLIGQFKPYFYLWENVKGAFFSNSGADFWQIIKEFTDIGGYRHEWQLLNTSWFLPQNRERIYLAGYTPEFCRQEIFPIQVNTRKVIGGDESFIDLQLNGAVETKQARTIQARYYKGCSKHSGEISGVRVGTLRTHNDGKGFREVQSDLCPTIPARAREDGSGQPIIENHEGIRRLTPLECERLQGFPDNWTKYGDYDGVIKEVSDTQRYKCIGNAVSVPVVKAVAERILQQSKERKVL